MLDRYTLDQWLELGKASIYSDAHGMVKEILASPLEDPLPEDAVHKMDKILTRVDQEFIE